MIVTKTDNIPNQKIVKVLRKIKTRDFKRLGEEECMQRLIRKAKVMGANAIINFTCEYWGYDVIDAKLPIYTGLAVIKEDMIPIQQALNTDVCWNCGTQIEKKQRYCRVCFAKLV